MASSKWYPQLEPTDTLEASLGPSKAVEDELVYTF